MISAPLLALDALNNSYLLVLCIYDIVTEIVTLFGLKKALLVCDHKATERVLYAFSKESSGF